MILLFDLTCVRRVPATTMRDETNCTARLRWLPSLWLHVQRCLTVMIPSPPTCLDRGNEDVHPTDDRALVNIHRVCNSEPPGTDTASKRSHCHCDPTEDGEVTMAPSSKHDSSEFVLVRLFIRVDLPTGCNNATLRASCSAGTLDGVPGKSCQPSKYPWGSSCLD